MSSEAQSEIEGELRRSQERYQSFIANSSEQIWCLEGDEPIPLDLDEEYSVELGRDRYAFMPRSADGWVSQVHCRNGEQVHEYHVNPTPRTIDHFEAVVLDSYRPEGEFVTQLRYVAFQRQSLIAVRNLRLIEVNAKGTHVTRLEKWQLPALMFERFGIPADITDAVVATMSLDGPAAYP